MKVKYIDIGVYLAANGNNALDSMTKVTNSVMPVIIGTPEEITAAAGSTQSLTYDTLKTRIAEKLPGIDVTRVVAPGYFRTQERVDGYYHYGDAAMSAQLIDFPLDVPSGYNLRHVISDRGVHYLSCLDTEELEYYVGTYYKADGTTFASSGPRSYCSNNSNGNRVQCMCATLRENNGVYDRYGVFVWRVTGDQSAAYNFSCNGSTVDLIALFNSVDMHDDPNPPTPGGEDPYLPDGIDPSGTGGGTGTFSETGDTVGIPGLPTLSAVDTGFITLFNPSAAQVKALANYMWSSSFDLATFKNIVANPIDCILGLTIVPVDPPNAGSKVVSVGNIPTDVTLPYLSSQYVEVDCGTLNVQEFWGSYLDYSPYTKMSLYLPYIGIIPLDIDDVMNASIAVKYHVDVLSGACVAYVLCNGTQLYTYVGQCSSNVPITSNDFTNTVNGILGIAGSIGKLAADGGASAPTEAAGIAANAINALKPNIQKSGAMSGTGGLMGVQTPYLICQRPRQSVPASQNAYTGYPANITARLSDLSGYTEVDSIHLDGLSATQEEQQEIMDLLTSGVII